MTDIDLEKVGDVLIGLGLPVATRASTALVVAEVGRQIALHVASMNPYNHALHYAAGVAAMTGAEIADSEWPDES